MSSMTREAVLQMDWKSIQEAIKNPATSAEMQTLLRDRKVVAYVSQLMLEAKNKEEQLDAELNRNIPPSTEQLAAEAQAMVETPVEASLPNTVPPVIPPPVVQSYEAEDAQLKAVGVIVVRDASGVATRYINEYQVMGEDGKAIGRPTHLEAPTLAALF